MAVIDFPSLNPAYLDTFGELVEYQPISDAAFDCMAIESRPRNPDNLDTTRPSFWFNLPADLGSAVDGRDLKVRPQVGDAAVIGGKTYVVVVDPHPDGAGGVYLTFELEI